jgi:hypothetical protein
MKVMTLAAQAASMKGWPARQEPSGELKIEVVTQPGRTQVVTVTMAKDGDGDAAAFIWAKACELKAVDPVSLLKLNMQLTYGRAALKGGDIMVVHALHDATADLAEVGKSIFYVAKAADDLERGTYGAHVDVL